MPPPKSHHNVYSEEAIRKCLDEIAKGSSAKAASIKYGIPRSTLRYWTSSKWQKTTRKGPSSVLSGQEEGKIVNWIIGMQQRGFPVQRRTLIFKVKEYLTASPRKTPFKNDCPGRKWFNSFMRRNPTLSVRTPEEVSSASARVTENDIRNWFVEVEKWLDYNDMRDICSDPSRIFNGDETSFYLHPKTKEVIALKGSQNVYEVEQACSKQNVTVMFSFGANGVVVDPMIILPGQRIRKEIAQGFPQEWLLGQSERGWMTAHNFGQYVKRVFHPFLLREGVKLPVIFFVDGHSSHVGVEVADLCQQLGVILIALYPNTTRITQPADVSIFKPLKDQWKNEVDDWRSEHPGENFTMRYFGRILEKAIAKGIKTDSIINGFRVCGLFPFNADNVDYSKCIAISTNCTPLLAVAKSEMISFETDCTTVPPEPETVNFSQVVQPEPSCSKHLASAASESFCSQLFLSGNNSTSVNMEIPMKIFSDFVPIHKDKIKEAVEVMGFDTVLKMQQSPNPNFSREERIIQYFYNEFIQPFTSFTNLPTTSELPMNEQHSMGGLDGTGTLIGELLIDTEGNVTISASEGTTQEAIVHSLNESTEIDRSFNPTSKDTVRFDFNSSTIKDRTVDQSRPNELSDITNTTSKTRKASISEFLNIPPAPRRSGKHRNYTKKYFPVLSAGERIAEIRKAEEEKLENERRKKIRAAERAEAKQKAEEAKKEKAERRNQKKLNSEQKLQQKKPRVLKRTQNTNDEKLGISKKVKTEKLKSTRI